MVYLTWWLSVARVLTLMLIIWRSKKNRVVGVSLDVLLQILRSLECLSTEVTLVRLQGNMDSDVGGDVITLDSGGSALVPSTGQVKVVGTLATDMFLTDVFLSRRVSLGLQATWQNMN